MEQVDVVVVGGGPGGTSAAKAAASGGADVVIIEKGVPREDREELGPDSTDAAGILDYWVDIMELDPSTFPDDIIYRTLHSAEFIGPTERVKITETGISSSYPHFGFTYNRTKFDEWLLSEAANANAQCLIGTPVTEIETVDAETPRHEVTLRDGTQFETPNVILADGPQRAITLNVLDQFLPDGRITDLLATQTANHIAYQEYREFPRELFEATNLKFWWGHIPGHTAYPWVFPNENTIARVGLTMPIGLDIEKIANKESYRLLREDDDKIPSGKEYIERLLEYEYGDEYDLDDFPIVPNRGKRDGTETYPISSTRPIDSPVRAGIAIVGGAMGATSAFHEGGAHVAVRSGKIAGELAASGSLSEYNRAWKNAIGEEILRNVVMADLVEPYEPADWDRAFSVARRLVENTQGTKFSMINGVRAGGVTGLRLALSYNIRKFRLRNHSYVQLSEDEYAIR